MSYWRMQLHPDERSVATAHAITCLEKKYIGLDFGHDVGDLRDVTPDALPKNQRHYLAFQRDMRVGDRVLVMAHHFPLALATIAGDYCYIRLPRELGVWFRHFRRVKDVRYCGDFQTDARKWQRLTMVSTIERLTNRNTDAYRLVRQWTHSR